MSCWLSYQHREQSDETMHCKKDLMCAIASTTLLLMVVITVGTAVTAFNTNNNTTTTIAAAGEQHNGIQKDLSLFENVVQSVRDGSIYAVFLQVENYTLPIEIGLFRLYEVYRDRIVLKDYLSFYMDEKELAYGTPIRFYGNNSTFAHVIGHHKNFYPITNKNSTLYCGIYWMDYIGRCKDVFYENTRYRCMEDLNLRIDKSLYDESCFIYM